MNPTPLLPQTLTLRTLVQADAIPTALVIYPHWVLWRYEPGKDGGKPHKAPYTPQGTHANITNPATWCSFDNALDTYTRFNRYHGIGFVLTQDSPIVGVDIDDCIEQGHPTTEAQNIINLLNSYTEISPSGNGLRIMMEADLGAFAGRRRGKIELYNYARYLTITGNRLPDSLPTLESRLQELRTLYQTYLAETPKSTQNPSIDRDTPSPSFTTRLLRERQPESPDDTEVLKRLFEGKLGMLYRDVYEGDIRNVQGQDESRADTLLFNGLAYYTHGNADQMRRILTNSPRYAQRGAKWHKKVSGNLEYLDYQIQDSITYTRQKHATR